LLCQIKQQHGSFRHSLNNREMNGYNKQNIKNENKFLKQ
jgi:hypothetical protein